MGHPDNNSRTPINTNLEIMDWLEYLWQNKYWFKQHVGEVVEKVLLLFRLFGIIIIL